MTNAELMQNPDYNEGKRATFSSNILVMSKQMCSLVEQMLELARADSILSDPAFSSVNFNQIVSDTILPFEPVFCEKGKIWVTLKSRGKGHCLLMVADEGKEISPKDLQHLFKRFYRADQARSRTGCFGLGLSIAESIVLRHKGKI